jgi:hypothetical protein
MARLRTGLSLEQLPSELQFVDVGENHGDDYVILRIKFELERIRLFFWGEKF